MRKQSDYGIFTYNDENDLITWENNLITQKSDYEIFKYK